MHNYLKELTDDSNVLYIYEIGLQIYGIMKNTENRDYLVIVDDNYIPDGFVKVNDKYERQVQTEHGVLSFQMMFIKDWFTKVLGSSMLACICAYLPKRYVIKEHVKLVLFLRPLDLRKWYEDNKQQFIEEALDDIKNGNTLSGQKALWKLIVHVMFSNQMIEHHKIINFKEVVPSYKRIVDGQITDAMNILQLFIAEITPHYERFRMYTDEMLAKSKQITNSKWKHIIL